MQLDLNGKTALVTASTAGIGLEVARSLAAEGATVIVNGRTEERVEKALAQIGSALPDAKLVALAADNGTQYGCDTIIAQFPGVDILVNNLGIYEPLEFFSVTDASWQKLFEVNIMSGVRLSRHYLKGMLARGHGHIVFISSESGINRRPRWCTTPRPRPCNWPFRGHWQSSPRGVG
jgi:3-oxoacyl-[acyl-carrier protein] reductase